MESSKTFDVPQGVLQPESEKRLARAFCFLRQHERKARAARKVAELQKLSLGASVHASRQHAETVAGGKSSDDADDDNNSNDTSDSGAQGTTSGPAAADAAVLFDQRDLLGELSLLEPGAGAADIGGGKSTRKQKANANADTSEQAPVSANASTTDSKKTHSLSPATAATAILQQQVREKHALMLDLGREIRELQKGILPPSSSVWSVDSVGGIPGCITAGDIVSAMKAMNRVPSKTEVQWMIWEADDDLDGCIDWHEFRSCYTRSLVDKHGLEPNQLYHFVQFLLCDTDESFTVSVLELKAELKKLPGTDHLASKLLLALKDDAEQQLVQKFTLSEYLDVMLSDLPPAFTRF